MAFQYCRHVVCHIPLSYVFDVVVGWADAVIIADDDGGANPAGKGAPSEGIAVEKVDVGDGKIVELTIAKKLDVGTEEMVSEEEEVDTTIVDKIGVCVVENADEEGEPAGLTIGYDELEVGCDLMEDGGVESIDDDDDVAVSSWVTLASTVLVCSVSVITAVDVTV